MSENIQKSAFLALFLTTLILFSCAKDGAIGPAGPTGLNGVNGANGKDGTNGNSGTPGKDGNANVQGQSFTINATDWIKSFYGTSTTQYYYRTVLSVPAITKSVLEKGLVMVYRSNSSSNANSFISLPYSDAYSVSGATYITNWTPVHYEGGVAIWKEDADLLTLAPTGGYTFKVVVITPQGKVANPNLNWSNYAEVSEALNLE